MSRTLSTVTKFSSHELEDVCSKTRKRHLTLPAAVAMSGAAISPSMGKMTRWPLRFLMALANVRLGVWVPNPRRLETFGARAPLLRKVHKHYPKPRVKGGFRPVRRLSLAFARSG
jgi:hypothetical protein